MTQLVTARAVRTARGILGNAILIIDGAVAAIGERAELLAKGVDELAFPDSVVIPGIRDAHFHPIAYTATVTGLTLDGAHSIGDVLAATEAAAGRGDGAVIGLRLNDEALTERRLPTAGELDRVSSGRPVMLHRYCGHVAVANSKTLAMAGIDADTPDPPGGVIDRKTDGSPTGVLRETAIDLASRVLADEAAVASGDVARALTGLAALGITSVGAMIRRGDGAWASLGNEAHILANAAPNVPIRLRCYIIADNAEQFFEAGQLVDGSGPDVRWQGLKRFGDGSFGGYTAAMHEPFADKDTIGTMRLDATDAEMVRIALEANKDVAIHAIGDRAGTAVIDLLTEARREAPDAVLRLEHASVLRPADIIRLAESDIIASVQPPFLGSETGWLAERVGQERLPVTYAFRSLADAGVTLAGGSDCPVENPDPWLGMALARDRAGIYPPEALSPSEALGIYTDGGATALGEPDPLSVGSPADFAVVDRDPVLVSPDELRETRVIATFVGGVQLDIASGPEPWPD